MPRYWVGCLNLVMLVSINSANLCKSQMLDAEGETPKPQGPPGLLAEESTAPMPRAENAARGRDIGHTSQPWLCINAGGHNATVQAVAFAPDSRRLYTAGSDKTVQVWDLGAIPVNLRARDIKRTFLRERTIRWQINRGLRGQVDALASAPNDGLVAMAGHGAMGSNGEILLVNPVEGTLVKVLEGHEQPICSLVFSANGQTLVSADVAGECRIWRRGNWNSAVLQETDSKRYGPEKARSLQDQLTLRPVAIVKDSQAIVPVLMVARAVGQAEWQLQQFALEDRQIVRAFKTPHFGFVTNLATTVNGEWLASADMAGNLYIWDLRTTNEPVRLEAGGVVASLAFSPDQKSLAVGTLVLSTTGKSRLQFWDLASKKLRSTRMLDDHVRACSYSPDGKSFAYVGGNRNEVFVDRLTDAASSTVVLAGGGRKILRVAFATEKPFYRVAFGTKYRDGLFNVNSDLEETFDPLRGQLNANEKLDTADWLPANWMAGNWHLKPSTDLSELQLYEGMTTRGVVKLDPQMGKARCSCWLPTPDGKPFAIAVGTDGQNMIHIFRLSPHGVCPLLRQFGGHQDWVTSIAVSRDLRFLASGSADGTLQFWPLGHYEPVSASFARWGTDFNAANGKLVVQSIDECGPLFRKGVRRGDTISQIGWKEQGERIYTEKSPEAMLKRLRDQPWVSDGLPTQVEIDVARVVGTPLTFQLSPSWHSLASLFVSEDREWAFWTAEGYYDASANGHTLFGWQINRGLFALPRFYRADQFRRTLERPDVLQRLLPSGSVEAALRNANQKVALDSNSILASQIQATPTVAILNPHPGDLVQDRSVKVRAKVTLPPDITISQTRVFANGVVGRQHQLIKQGIDAATGERDLLYEWEALLPKDVKNLLQVSVLTDAKTTAFAQVAVEQRELPPAAAPRMYILAIGVNNYQDPNIPKLINAVADAESLATAFQKGSPGLYEVTAPNIKILKNESVTRARWDETFATLTAKLKDVARPDDLLVIFMAGHGVVDHVEGMYHYVCQDAELDTLFDGKRTISWVDFGVLADIPCRKLAFLDSCHSGAIRGVAQQHKLAIRDFQDNLIFTVAAAADDEQSMEHDEWHHGAFTKSLLEGLAGAADESRDGFVTLNELIAYAHRIVPKLTGGEQHPAAAPAELLQAVSLPLSINPRPAVPRAQSASSSTKVDF